LRKDTKPRTTVSELQIQTIVMKRKDGMSFTAISKEMGIAKSTVRYNYRKEMERRVVSNQGNIVRTMQSMDLRNKVMVMCDDLVHDVKELGASKDEIQIRVAAINCVKGVVVAFELSEGTPPTTSIENEHLIVADVLLADLSPEQVETKLSTIRKRMAASPQTNGGMIR